MHLDITPSEPARLSDADNFRQLDVRAPDGLDTDARRDRLAEVGAALEGEHAWIPVRSLRDLGRPTDESWTTQLDAMLEYAAGSGWVRTVDGVDQVRAHLTTL
ncbi:hypothetical protein [Nocardioides marmotae]|uniref:hypothetical protein n=1 Tax=Nocardioides marmotae TaxID=2663857 RepID=UPI0012B5D523|nr:hypothetical protein [Nocardioides marmotae]MBC9732432.1 hypothetical protein [Nocardioides marmotae]MTB83552.1 hypothetical protein [Nocardioides marmotae]